MRFAPVGRVLVLLLSVSVAGGCVGAQRNDSELSGGFDGVGWLDSMDVGSRFTGGQIVIENTSNTTMRIVDVRPRLAPDAQLEFLGAYVAGEGRPWATTDRRAGFPPDESQWGPVNAAVGAEIPPLGPEDRGLELLLGFAVDGSGRSQMEAVSVDYEVNGVQKTLTISTTIIICTPSTAPCTPS